MYIFELEADVIVLAGGSDMYCGCLAVALVERKSLQESVRFAHAASAICLSGNGELALAPFRKEIDKYLNSLTEHDDVNSRYM